MKKQSKVFRDVLGNRVRVVFPISGLTVEDGIQLGITVGGVDLVASENLRIAARDALFDQGVDYERISPHGVSLHGKPAAVRVAGRARRDGFEQAASAR